MQHHSLKFSLLSWQFPQLVLKITGNVNKYSWQCPKIWFMESMPLIVWLIGIRGIKFSLPLQLFNHPIFFDFPGMDLFTKMMGGSWWWWGIIFNKQTWWMAASSNLRWYIIGAELGRMNKWWFMMCYIDSCPYSLKRKDWLSLLDEVVWSILGKSSLRSMENLYFLLGLLSFFCCIASSIRGSYGYCISRESHS